MAKAQVAIMARPEKFRVAGAPAGHEGAYCLFKDPRFPGAYIIAPREQYEAVMKSGAEKVMSSDDPLELAGAIGGEGAGAVGEGGAMPPPAPVLPHKDEPATGEEDLIKNATKKMVRTLEKNRTAPYMNKKEA